MSEQEEKVLSNYLPADLPIDGLTQNQVDFVDQLIIQKCNRYRAYKTAYPKCKTLASAGAAATRLLKKVKIRKLLAFRLAQLREQEMVEINQIKVIRELNRLAYSSVGDICSWNADGSLTMRPSEELTEHELSSVKKIKCTRTIKRTKDGDEYETTVIEIEQHDKKGALDTLARASKLIDNSKATVPVYISLDFGSDKAKSRKISQEKVVN